MFDDVDGCTGAEGGAGFSPPENKDNLSYSKGSNWPLAIRILEIKFSFCEYRIAHFANDIYTSNVAYIHLGRLSQSLSYVFYHSVRYFANS